MIMKYKFVPVILIFFFSISCKKFVEIGPPTTQIVTADVLSNSNTVTSALTAIYTQMFNNNESWYMAQDQGLLADELKSYSTAQDQLQFYTNSMSAINNNGNWNNAYNYIYQANALIVGLKSNGNISPAISQQIVGEAKFMRAFWHFYLTNMYGDIPVVTTTDYTINGSIARTPRAQVYTQIISDLIDAETFLNSNYVDVSDTAITTERVRPTKGAAQAMLARTYLYTQKFDSAEAEATLVINNTSLYGLCLNLSPMMGPSSVFLKNSTEAIWQLGTPLPASNNTIDAQYFILAAAPSTGDQNSATISSQLMNSFEANDLRKANWIGVYINPTDSSVQYFFPYKYQAYNTANPISEYTMVLRLAEQYLIRAEARAQQSNLSGAASDLNVIRNRAGLANISDAIASSQSALLTAILHERQVELFTEWGHRWFDLNRTGAINSVMGTPGNVCQAKGGAWNSDWELYPIPQSDIMNDQHLSQNPGY
jgi:hypothetical protein